MCALAFISVAEKSKEKTSLQSSFIPSTVAAEAVQTGNGSMRMTVPASGDRGVSWYGADEDSFK